MADLDEHVLEDAANFWSIVYRIRSYIVLKAATCWPRLLAVNTKVAMILHNQDLFPHSISLAIFERKGSDLLSWKMRYFVVKTKPSGSHSR